MKKSQVNVLDFTVIAIIGLICAAFSIFGSSFAKLHITLLFLDFPIFVSEIILAILLIILVTKISSLNIKLGKFNYLLMLLFLFILAKAALGYWKHGPLALRNAAMFYYALFAIIGYYFFNRKFFSYELLNTLLLCLLILNTFLFMPGHNAFFTYFALILILSYKIKNKIIKFSGFILAFYFITRYCFLSQTARGHALSVVLAFLFLITETSLLFYRKVPNKKAFLFVASVPFILLFVFLLSNKTMAQRAKNSFNFINIINEFKTQSEYLKLPNPPDTFYEDLLYKHPPTIKLYDETNKYFEISKHFGGDRDKEEILMMESKTSDIKPTISKISFTDIKSSYEIKESTLKLLSENKKALELAGNYIIKNMPDSYFNGEVDSMKDNIVENTKAINEIIADIKNNTSEEIKPDLPKKIEETTAATKKIIDFSYELATGKSARQIDSVSGSRDVNSIAWRLFVWRDMIEDMYKNKAILGLDFGKPIQTPSLTKLYGITGTAWRRSEENGNWVEPHNSYFHILYRTGIIGIVIFIIIFTLFIRMVRSFIVRQSFTGIVLCSALLFYLSLSMFIVFLELPQFTIPFWLLFGMTYSYYKENG